MRVVHLIQGVHRISAGPTPFIGRLVEEQRRAQLHSQIHAIGPAPGQWPYDAPLEVHGGAFANRFGVARSFVTATRKALHTADVVHGHGLWRLSNLFPLFQSTPTAKLVCSPHGMLSGWSLRHRRWRKAPFWHLAQAPALARIDLFHATAESEYLDIRRLGFTQPIVLLPIGIDVPAHRAMAGREQQAGRAGHVNSTSNVLFLGRIHPVKGIDVLLRAWQPLEAMHPGWTLTLAGPGEASHLRDAKALAGSLGLRRCAFVGEVTGDAKAALFAQARYLVLPSRSENFAVVVAEALACALPVIASTATPWHELPARGCGWFVPPDVSPLRDALRQALCMPDAMHQQMGARGRAWMQQDYSWPVIAERMSLAYSWLRSGGLAPAEVRVDEAAAALRQPNQPTVTP